MTDLTREGLVELAAKVEQASGPDRRLDYEIMTSTLPAGRAYLWDPNDNNHRYTSSVNAAMTLIPDDADAAGERFRLEAYNSPGVLAPHVRASAWVAGAPRCYAANEALALCAAALKARARAMEAGRG